MQGDESRPLPEPRPARQPIKSVHREIIYNRGTQAAIEFAERQEEGVEWSTHDLVAAVIDAVWNDIKESKG